jgi:Mg2+ transporter MgtE
MLFFSELQEAKVLDSKGRVAGKISDIGMDPGERLPQSQSLVISRHRRGKKETTIIPWDRVVKVDSSEVVLNRPREWLWKSEPCQPGLLLGRNILDRQIVDLDGNKVVRVNDIRLAEFDSHLRLTGVDVSQRALLKRLGVEKPLTKLLRALGIDLPENSIPWNLVAPLEVEQPDLKLTITQSQLVELHPTDLADILEQLDPKNRERLLDLIGAFMAAESLSEIEPGKQADFIEDLSEVKASNLLEIMPPDEAADILSLLQRDKAERLLNIMGVEEAEVIRELLGYRRDSAGGRMTPEFLAVPSSITAQECIEYLREKAPSAETLYYLYVIDDERRLKGVVSLRDLLTSSPDRKVEDFMHRDVISVNVDDDQEMVADIMSRYNFLALPVVDNNNFLKGIITVDDMIDVMREETIEDLSHLGGLELSEGRRRLPLGTRLPSTAITLIGGIAAALLLSAFENRLVLTLALVFFLPLILRTAQDVGIFSQAFILEAIGGKDPGAREMLLLAWKELRTVFLLSLMLGLVGGTLAGLWEWNASLGLAVGLTMLCVVILGALSGIAVPLISRRVRGELRYTQARFSSLFIAMAALTIYLGMANALLG